MGFSIAILAASLLLVQHVACFSAPSSSINGHGNLHTVYEFPNLTWVENVAVRPNGNLLVTLITSPEVWEIDPAEGTGSLVYRFPKVTSAFAIIEYRPDVFAIATGNYSFTTLASVPGTYSVWNIDHSTPRKAPTVRKIADVPQASIINGGTALPNSPGTILLGDSDLGLIYELDIKSKKSKVWADDPLFKTNTSIPLKLGINGIQHHNGQVYFTNSFATPVLGRVKVTRHGKAILPAEVVVAEATFPTYFGAHGDDFTFDKRGNLYITTGPSDQVVKITPRGNETVVAGASDNATVAGATSAKFGRRESDCATLYIVTNGGIPHPPPSGIVGGKIIALDTRHG